MNPKICQSALNYLANQMQPVDKNNSNPIESLSIDDIVYLQTYLEQVKRRKTANLNKQLIGKNRATDIYDPIERENPVDWRDFSNNPNQYVEHNQLFEPGPRGATSTRISKKNQNDYYNPYEYGAKQSGFGTIQYEPQIASDYLQETFPGQIRNVNIESSLKQCQNTRLPGQRLMMDKQIDRFQMLPFNPQDPSRLVWSDNMPRNGYPTRTDRLEL